MEQHSDLLVVTDGLAGNRRQALALAGALGLPYREQVLVPHAPWRWLAPRRLPGAGRGFDPALTRLPPPRLAIGCGRQAALATRLLRARGTQTVQILDPRIDPAHWNLVIAPAHDGLAGANVIAVAGSLNPIDDAWLDAARQRFPALASLPAPRTAVLLGGDSAHWRFDRAGFDALAMQLQALQDRDGGSLLFTTSRRTPAEVATALRARFADSAGLLWCGDSDGENPYPGLLGWSDRIVCTPDSVNMLSEACATRAPVWVFDPHGVQGRPRRFIDDLRARGRIHDLAEPALASAVEPLRETARVAALARQRLGLDAS
ncbi:nucleoside-diphosphate sugar epimerase [Pseudoxanthomonas kalamensis DSM 18571]|uniref:mitochondrial fission ELM1 family protein n=1 Tax=Pseudoxanthomonas kalamensis TaxID=289483 RepID=UPI0013915134|nr:mitochondrial fission ELM1 family protein [Pseudoxanthomonas kalamensis]KAF1712014.1 nucleoside-diphosphate sugar epimerase [Pseudoxanthomonas kalamensis DSM 18571]